jgi:hypothetical protein
MVECEDLFVVLTRRIWIAAGDVQGTMLAPVPHMSLFHDL